MNSIGLNEIKEKTLGKVGTAKRDKYELDLKIEILEEHIKQARLESKNLKREKDQ